VEHGDLSQPRLAVSGHYARDTAETRDPSWWRGVLERGGYGMPWLRVYAVPSMASMAGCVTLATVEAGLPAANVRVVTPERVALRVPGLGVWLATVTGETAEALPVYGLAHTTWFKLRTAIGAMRHGRE